MIATFRLVFVALLGSLFSPLLVVAASGASLATRPTTVFQSTTIRSKTKDRRNSTQLLQIVETETFFNGTWHHPTDGSAWTHPSTGETMVPPLQYKLQDEDKDWQGEWKIAITGRSSYGWNYYYDTTSSSPLLQYTIRRRTWLRTIIVTAPPIVQRSWIPSTIAEDWNFKGYGWTIYKSAVFPKSFGLGFRIPLTSNLASWETYQIPASLSITITAFNSWDWPALHLNASIRMEWLQWFFEQIFNTFIPAIIQSFLLLLLNGLLVAANALLYPAFRKPTLWNDSIQGWLWKSYRTRFRGRSIRYASDREERLGVCWTFRFWDRVRFSAWHYNAWQIPSILPWVTRRSAALGWSISGPVTDEPDLLCSVSICFLLSGYYFRRIVDSTLSVDQRKDTPATGSSKVSVVATPSAVTTSQELKETKKQVSEALSH